MKPNKPFKNGREFIMPRNSLRYPDGWEKIKGLPLRIKGELNEYYRHKFFNYRIFLDCLTLYWNYKLAKGDYYKSGFFIVPAIFYLVFIYLVDF